MAYTQEQEEYLRKLEEEKSEDARARAARFGRYTRRAQVIAPSGGLTVTVARAAGQGNPVNAGPINFTVTFSKSVTGFTNADISFTGSTVGGTLAAAVTGTGPYNVAVTGMTGNGLVRVSIPAGAATDATGAPSPASMSATVMFDATAPSVTINKAAGQADPATTAPINFTIVFSEAVIGFTSSDVSFAGSTAAGTLAAAVTGSGPTYNVAVTGMTGDGDVVATIPATVVTDLAGNANSASTSTDNIVTFTTAGSITHGSQLIPQGSAGVNVGPTALLGSAGYPANLQVITPPGGGNWRADNEATFIEPGTYVYNNTVTNRGGIVPAGGLTIDGYFIPAGTRVLQFKDFSQGGFLLNTGNSYLFRGCRFRGPSTAPGFFNTQSDNTGNLHVFFCDLGGLSGHSADSNEVPIKISHAPSSIIYRNYVSYTTTGVQMNLPANNEVTENYISKLSLFNPGFHLNGIAFNGGETNALVLRNNIVIATPDEDGNVIEQTDCIAFFNDFGSYPGTGTNRDGSLGYKMENNYIGGTGYCIYAGGPAAQNMKMTGNRMTTLFYPNGGSNGAIHPSQPVWGTTGNVRSDNNWADGPNAGSPFDGSTGGSGPTVSFGSAGTYLNYAARTNSTLAAPAGIANNDLLIAYLAVGQSSSPTTPTPPGGWSTLPGSPIQATVAGFFVKFSIFYKIASSESGDYLFTHPAGGSSCGVVMRYTGVDIATPFSPTPTTNTGTGTISTALGFTTTVANTFIVFTETDWADNTADTVPPTGTTPTFTERVDQVLMYIADGTLALAGATGDKSHTNNSAFGGAWTSYLIGLKPAP